MGFTPMTFEQLQELLANQYAAQAQQPANTNQGSSLGAIFNAIALLALNVQNELVYVQNISRMLTSTGADIDSWGLQFGLPRVGASAASGTVNFGLSQPALTQQIVPIGGIVQTAGNLQFAVTVPTSTDPNYGNYNPVLGGYVVQVGQSSVNATVTCTAPGIIGNVGANTITQVGSTGSSPIISGFSSITNPIAFTNGQTSETDVEYQTRLTLALSTGTVATQNATAAAILAVQPGLTYSIGDGFNVSGTSACGQFTVVVNELGLMTGPPQTLLNNVYAAVLAVKSAGIQANVIGPQILSVDVSAAIHFQSGMTPAQQTQALANMAVLVQEYLDGIGLDPAGESTTAEIAELYVVLRTYPGVTNVNAVQLKLHTSGGWQSNDIIAGWAQQLVSSGVVTFTVI